MLGPDNVGLVFRNELLVKLNQAHRLSSDAVGSRLPSTIMRSRSFSPIKNALYAMVERAVSWASLLLLLVSRAPGSKTPDSAFLYVDKRLLRFCREGVPAYQLGLYKYLLCLGKGHLYRYLSAREVLRSLSCAVSLKKSMAAQICPAGTIEKLNVQQALFLSGFGFLRCLDLFLALASISRLRNIDCAGHFDVYTALISQLRESGKIDRFCGIQHGLYEYFLFGKPAPLFYDEYHLLFRESEPYFRQYLSANPDCVFQVQERKSVFSRCEDKGTTVGVALQNDDEVSDSKLLWHLQQLVPKYRVLAYVHPATSAQRLKELQVQFPDIGFEAKQRCANVDAVITRYSTLAMDYVAIGVPAVFWAAPDRVCASFSGHPLVHQIVELSTLQEVLVGILSRKGGVSS